MNDKEHNPGQDDIDKKTNFLRDRENISDDYNSPEKIKDLQDAEENPANSWKVNIDKQKNDIDGKISGRKNKAANILAKRKGKGPLAAIILTLVGGGLGISTLLSPSLLLINMKEVFVNKFNTQLTSSNIRTNKIIREKVFGTGSCAVRVLCNFSTMSDYQIERYRKFGIEIDYEDSIIPTRRKVKSIKYKNETMDAMAFSKKLNVDPDFRIAVKKVYSPLFAGFADKIWNKTLFNFKLTENGIKFSGETPEQKLRDIQNRTKQAAGIEIDTPDLEKYTDGLDSETIDINKNISKNLDEIVEGATEIIETGTKSVSKVAKKAAGFLNVTGLADDACTAYSTVRTIGVAAKTVRAAQAAAFIMLFLTSGDQILAAGNPDPDTISYLGSILTNESTEENFDGTPLLVNGKTVKKTATDSYGYKYAAYGDIGNMPDSTSQFLIGAGLAGSLIGLTSHINNTLGGSPQKTCKVLNNVFVQLGSLAAGIAVAFMSGGGSLTVGGAVKILSVAAVSVALAFLPSLLKDIVAGVFVDEFTVGGHAGDAITAGAGVLMGKVASQGGNAPLTKEQAIAYNNKTKEILAIYAEEERINSSPFDISNSSTFMGNIVSKLIPHTSKITSPSKLISSSISLMSSTINSFSPIVKANDGSEYEICTDEDYRELNLAADPFCNLVYGIPVEELDKEPTDVVNYLLNVPDPRDATGKKMLELIDKETGLAISGGGYQKFLDTCINRTTPIGYTGIDFNEPSGEECKYGNNFILGKFEVEYIEGIKVIRTVEIPNSYMYLYTIDQRIVNGMDGEDSNLVAAYESGISDKISFYNGINDYSNNIASNNIIDNIISFIKNPFSFIYSENKGN
jgi:hypothetical protein